MPRPARHDRYLDNSWRLVVLVDFGGPPLPRCSMLPLTRSDKESSFNKLLVAAPQTGWNQTKTLVCKYRLV